MGEFVLLFVLGCYRVGLFVVNLVLGLCVCVYIYVCMYVCIHLFFRLCATLVLVAFFVFAGHCTQFRKSDIDRLW